MMLAKTYSYGITGLDAFLVQIEIYVSRGLPATMIVGLPDSAIKESKERVRSAIKNSGYTFPGNRKTINLSPANTKKEGPAFDLAIAIGLLAATEQMPCDHLENFCILGELSLDGRIQAVRGSLPITLSLNKSRFRGIIIPHANAHEAAASANDPSLAIYPIKTLQEAVHILSKPESVKPFDCAQIPSFSQTLTSAFDFSDVKGQEHVKRGLEVAAAGNHNVLLIGSPGTGKSMLCQRFPSILPDMTMDESIETTKIHSVMGLLKDKQGLVRQRPFRSPHHTTSDVALVGGGSHPRPGEVTLAHNGVLFLDELPEFSRQALEALRQPLENKNVTIARAAKSAHFPANFLLIAAMNPCPCGWLTDPKKECRCSSIQIQKYLTKISGPLLDRIDIHLEVPSLPSLKLLSSLQSEDSKSIQERTMKARHIQHQRFQSTMLRMNAQMQRRDIAQFCALSSSCQNLLKQAIEELHLSARAYDKILKVSRSIADLEEKKDILPEHITEAIQYRYLDRDWWK